MVNERYRLVIIGAGSAGLAAADFASRLGVRVALVERNRVGGDCTWTGCVPSKALLHVAEICHIARRAQDFGVGGAGVTIDFQAAMTFVRRAIQDVYRYETPAALAARGITVIQGEARFLDARTLDVAGRQVQGDAFLLTPGARPVIPTIPGLEVVPYLTYETVFELSSLPLRLAIVGGGPVGVELAQAFQRLGSQVTLLDHHDRVISIADPEASAALERALERDGVNLRLRARVDRVSQTSGDIMLHLGEQTVLADALLVAAGRGPSVESLNLDQAGVVWSERGIMVEASLRTSQPHIYACGDAVGSFQFTHYAAWQAVMAVRNALLPGRTRGWQETVPWTLFTEPEIAQVGLDEQRARLQHGDALRVVRWPIERIDRAVTQGETDGFLKLLHLPKGRLLGATIVSRQAGELANELSVALSKHLSVADLAGAIHVYPTYGFAIQQAAADSYYSQLGHRLGPAVRFLARHWPTGWALPVTPFRSVARAYTAEATTAAQSGTVVRPRDARFQEGR